MLSKFNEDVILQQFMAEKLLPNQLPNIYKIYPRLAKNLTILGPLKYALEMKRKYSNPN